jgi:hypothetical protein
MLQTSISFIPLLSHGPPGLLMLVYFYLDLDSSSLVGKLLNKCFNPPTSADTWGLAHYAQQLHTHVESIWQVYLCLNANESVGLPLVKAQAETNVHLVTLFQANVPVAEGHIIWPRPDSIEVTKDRAGNRHMIKITPSCSLILITKVLRPNSIHRHHGQCLSWIFDHEKQAVVTTSTLRTRGAVTPIPGESTSDIAAIPSIDLTESFTLSIPADGQSFVPALVALVKSIAVTLTSGSGMRLLNSAVKLGL